MSPDKGSKYEKGRRAPFVMVPVALLDDPRVDAQAIATYAALLSYCDFGSGEGAFCTDRRATSRAHVGVRTLVDRRLKLKEWGWLDWDSGKETGRSNTYQVHQVGCAGDADPPVQEMQTPSSLDTESQIPGKESVHLPVMRQGMTPVKHSEILGHLQHVEEKGKALQKHSDWESLVIMVVYAYWVAINGRDNARVRLSQDKAFLIRGRLRDGGGGSPDPASCLLYAVDGALLDPRLVQTDKGVAYLEIDNIFRSWGVVERCCHHMEGYREGLTHAMVEKHAHLKR